MTDTENLEPAEETTEEASTSGGQTSSTSPEADASSEASGSGAIDSAAEEGAEVAAVGTSAPAAAAPPAEIVPPKERKRRSRAAKSAKTPVGKPRSPEERHEDRVAARRAKAAQRGAGRAKERAKARAGEHQAAVTPAREHVPGTQKTRQGVVVSNKADKTITVRIDISRRHRRYQKIVATSTKVHAHDERNDANEGDTVIVRECRPLSRSKRWRLVEVVERAK